MSGIMDLAELLRSLSPVLDPEHYVFHSLAPTQALPATLLPWAMIREEEGLTLIVSAEQARTAGFSTEQQFARLELRVHSSLLAVGLTAAVAGALAADQISANVVAAFYHDHLFVPAARAADAMQILQQLALDAAVAGQ